MGGFFFFTSLIFLSLQEFSEVFSVSLEAQFEKWMDEVRPSSKFYEGLTQLCYFMETSDKFFMPTTSASVAFCIFLQLLLCHKVVVMILDFNRGVLSPPFLHLTSGRWGTGEGLTGRSTPCENSLDHQFPGEFRELCLFLCDCPVVFGNGAELTFLCTHGQVGTSLELPVGCPSLCPEVTHLAEHRIRHSGTCREGCSIVGQHL